MGVYKIGDYLKYNNILDRTEISTYLWKVRADLMSKDVYDPDEYHPNVPMEFETYMTLRRN